MKYAVLLLIAAPGLAPGQDTVNPATGKSYLAPDAVAAGIYEIDPKESLVRYEVMHFGYNEFWGTFPHVTGNLELDPKNLAAAKIDVKVPIVGIQTGSQELDHELFSDIFFDGEKYPDMHFVSTAIERTGAKTANLLGNLTIRDVTRPVILKVVFTGAGPVPAAFGNDQIIGFRAEGSVKRSDFGVGKFVPVVSDETRIVISVSMRKR